MSCHSSLLAFLLFFFLFLLFPPRPFSSFLPSFCFFSFTVLVGSSTCVVTYIARIHVLSVSCSRCAFPFRATRKRFFFFRPIYIYIPLLANLTDNSSLLHSPSTRSARLTFFPRSSSPLRYLLPCTPFIFQRARAIGILTTEAALSSPRYPDPDGCEISRTKLARVQSIISSQNVFDVSEGKHVTSTIFSPLSFIAILDVPRNPLSLVQFFRDSIVRIFDA